jgi:hypothetical protein
VAGHPGRSSSAGAATKCQWPLTTHLLGLSRPAMGRRCQPVGLGCDSGSQPEAQVLTDSSPSANPTALSPKLPAQTLLPLL